MHSTATSSRRSGGHQCESASAGDGLARLRRVAWVVCLLGSVAAFILTFALTEQAPGETTALSQSVERWVTTGDTAQSAATSGSGGSPEGGGGAAGALLSVANIRRWAHVPEFFLQGLFLFGAAALWPQGRHGARRGQGPRGRLLVALAACAACSLFDQGPQGVCPRKGVRCPRPSVRRGGLPLRAPARRLHSGCPSALVPRPSRAPPPAMTRSLHLSHRGGRLA